MNLTAHFKLATKTQHELKGLYCTLFNKLASEDLFTIDQQHIQAALYRIQSENSNRRP